MADEVLTFGKGLLAIFEMYECGALILNCFSADEAYTAEAGGYPTIC